MPRKNQEAYEINKIVGSRIQTLRVTSGLSRTQLAKKIDLSHQQLLKYEDATNAITCGKLAILARELGKPIQYFFVKEKIKVDKHSRLCVDVSRDFLKIEDPEQQIAVRKLIHTLIK